MRRLLLPVVAFLFLAGATSTDTNLTERQRALHVLNRLAFGPRPGDVDRVLSEGVDRWIDQQLHPEAIPDRAVDARLREYGTLRMSNAEIVQTFYAPIVEMRREAKNKADNASVSPQLRKEAQRVMQELVGQRIVRAADSDRQLNEVMVDFWMNHFNVFAGKGIDRFLLTSYERDTIRPLVWGRFEDLLMATAKSPAMLFYLDNARSVAAPENRLRMQRQQMGGGFRRGFFGRRRSEEHTSELQSLTNLVCRLLLEK